MKFIDYGVFSSFAPNFDSATSSLSLSESSICLKRKLKVEFEFQEDPTSQSSTNTNNLNKTNNNNKEDTEDLITETQDLLHTLLESNKYIKTPETYDASFLSLLQNQGVDISLLLTPTSSDLLNSNTTHIKTLVTNQNARYLYDSDIPTQEELHSGKKKLITINQ